MKNCKIFSEQNLQDSNPHVISGIARKGATREREREREGERERGREGGDSLHTQRFMNWRLHFVYCNGPLDSVIKTFEKRRMCYRNALHYVQFISNLALLP